MVSIAVWLCIAAPTCGQSALDGFDPNPNALSIYAIVVQPDGKILIGGSFSMILGVPRNGIARLNANGTLDTAFNANVSGSSYVLSIVLQADGKILLGGSFDSVGGQARYCMARVESTTGAADSFNPNPNDQVFSIAVQPDGKILTGGYFTNIGTAAQSHGAARSRRRFGRFVRSECPFRRFWRTIHKDSYYFASGKRQDLSGRAIHEHRRTVTQLHRTVGSHDRRSRFIQFKRGRGNLLRRVAGGWQDTRWGRIHHCRWPSASWHGAA